MTQQTTENIYYNSMMLHKKELDTQIRLMHKKYGHMHTVDRLTGNEQSIMRTLMTAFKEHSRFFIEYKEKHGV